jgi:hypothetical protein
MTSVVADIRQVVWSTNCTRPIGEALSCGQRALQGSHSVTMAVTRDILYAYIGAEPSQSLLQNWTSLPVSSLPDFENR